MHIGGQCGLPDWIRKEVFMENTISGKKFHIQWFPGHMTKAKRMMEANLKLVDVVVELLDARIPRSSANPMLQQLIGAKQKIVVLNKTDMADPERTQAWLSYFKKNSFTALEVDCQKAKESRPWSVPSRKPGNPPWKNGGKKGSGTAPSGS